VADHTRLREADRLDAGDAGDEEHEKKSSGTKPRLIARGMANRIKLVSTEHNVCQRATVRAGHASSQSPREDGALGRGPGGGWRFGRSASSARVANLSRARPGLPIWQARRARPEGYPRPPPAAQSRISTWCCRRRFSSQDFFAIDIFS